MKLLNTTPTLDSEYPDELEYAGRQRNIGFPSSQLLVQGIESLRLSTLELKLDAITALEFPQTLKALGKYLGMTSLLRQYVNSYGRAATGTEDFTVEKRPSERPTSKMLRSQNDS